jgi:filamentous hemagglutinin family protein
MKLPLFFFLLIISLSVPAQITTDGSLGPQLNLSGPDYQIGPDLGQQRGGNLFHSFQDFNLQRLESATFSGPNHIQNVISRVTGGNPSQIDGLFRSTIPGVDVYFLNPYGIMFGPNAKLDVQGSFHASTADYLRLGNGGRFSARNPSNSVLTVAPIESFGFLTDSASRLTIQDSKLSVSEGKTLSFLGGELQITGTNAFRDEKTRFPVGNEAAVLSAPAGRINLASVANQNTLKITHNDVKLTVNERSGSFQATHSIFDVTGEGGGGSLFIRGGDVTLTNTQIDSQTFGSKNGGVIDIQVANLHLINGSEIFTRTSGIGNATALRIHATDTIEFYGMNANQRASTIDARTLLDSSDGGNASEILIEARNMSFLDGAHVYSETNGGGNGPQITIRAEESVRFSGVDSSGWRIAGFTMDAFSQADGAGNAGNLLIEAKDITFENGAGMQSGTAGLSNSANATIRATGTFTLKGQHKDGTGSQLHTGVMDKSTGGQGGNLIIEVGELSMNDGARIYASTNGPGHGGHITIHATGTVTLLGLNQKGEASRIVSESKGGKRAHTVGNSGRIVLMADKLTLRDGTNISTSAKASSNKLAGKAGEIQITVGKDMLLTGFNPYAEKRIESGSGIYAVSQGHGDNSGDAGQIIMKANALTIEEGAVIRSSTNNNAKGGHIDLEVGKTIKIVGHTLPLEDIQLASGIYASSESVDVKGGFGGNIILKAGQLMITHQGIIATSSAGGGQAGNITLHVKQLQMDGSASITSESQLPNTYQFGTLAERDNGIVILGDVIDIASDEDGKISHYANVGNRLIRIQPVYTVAHFADLLELSKQYKLKEGYVVEVKDIGNGQSARFVYSYNGSYKLEDWIKLEEQPISVTFDTQDDMDTIKDWFNPDEIPYPSGTFIQVNDRGDGKPALFVYSANIVIPVNGKLEGAPVRISSFDVTDNNALIQLTQMSLDDGDIALINDQHFVFQNGQWMRLTGNIHQVANPLEIEKLVQAQIGNVAQVANLGNGQPGDFIYTSSAWIPLNPKHYTVQNLAELEKFPATTGDLVAVENTGTNRYEHFFYVDGQWLKQVKGGNAGTITINADENLRLSHDSKITTAAISAGGGAISIHADGFVLLQDSQISTSVQEGAGNGGDMKLNPEFIILNNGQIIARANEGQGGNINITTTGIYTFPPESASSIDASSKLGIDGEVNIASPEVDLDAMLVVLPGIQLEAKFPKGCGHVRTLEELNTFRGYYHPPGRPMMPGDFPQ